jgi:hypothetical protein
MYAIQVGKPLNPHINSWPPMPEYNFINGSHELIISYANPHPQEIAAVEEGMAQFAFTVIRDIIVFQYRFGAAMPCSDCGYNWHRVSAEARTLPDMPGPGERAMLHVIFIEISEARDAGVVRLITVGTDLEHSLIAIQVA